jgi:hypothetical protein
MTKVDDLNAKVDALQAAVDADQASDAKVVADLQAEVDLLKGELANGASPEQLDALATRLDAIAADVAGPNA